MFRGTSAFEPSRWLSRVHIAPLGLRLVTSCLANTVGSSNLEFLVIGVCHPLDATKYDSIDDGIVSGWNSYNYKISLQEESMKHRLIQDQV